MTYAFVRFVEHHGKEVGDTTCFIMTSGKSAESCEAFIDLYHTGIKITVTNLFKVPEDWENAVSGGSMNDVFEALLGLNALNDNIPFVSDLLTTIFAEGFKCGERHDRDVQAAFKRGRASRGK
ncbi:MAG: hypothetical protein AAB575_05885 [Patescibacteria group bacterium]